MLAPTWALELLRHFDPVLELRCLRWSSEDLDQVFSREDPLRLAAIGASRWTIWEKAHPRNRECASLWHNYTQGGELADRCCRVAPRACIADGHGWAYRELDKPILIRRLQDLDVALSRGDPAEWLRRDQARVERVRDIDEAANDEMLRADDGEFAGALMRMSHENDLVGVRNPNRMFAVGAPGAAAASLTGYTRLGELFVPNTLAG